jgi:hypothetical protein
LTTEKESIAVHISAIIVGVVRSLAMMTLSHDRRFMLTNRNSQAVIENKEFTQPMGATLLLPIVNHPAI